MNISLLARDRAFAPITNFTRRSYLPLRRDALWLIKTGVVRTLTVLEDGTAVTLGLWGEGDIVGRVLSQANPYQIECLTPVEATLIPEQNWSEVTQAMLLHMQRSEEFIEILHYKQAESSLLRLFGWLAKRFGQEVEQGKRIDLRLTHQDIADIIGLTRVTVTRLLNEFKRLGVIQRQERQFVVMQDRDPYWHYEI
ncbi:Crp/Fnr family transcriptional regulator [Aliterella atlantica]|uniref:Crp/Fnr family transcriptional regulator n=1 Tax=Aliterella atlantica CENA595 TaxID=1618023 RepID=A0A0D8ZSH2_9CYAN|nr:Crp/Fnr family transcriptional regulator [Aliterella atlantica]KJH70171.1 Crp/Fnr family transcriptional regulator [Aliterella atlantica CENA595]